MRLPSLSATKRSTEQNAAFVPGNKICQFLEGRILKNPARVGSGLGDDGEGKVAIFSRGVRIHGLLSFERLGVRGSRADGVGRPHRQNRG
jgi:hypothetical protein